MLQPAPRSLAIPSAKPTAHSPRLRDHPSHFHRTPLFRVWRQRRIACSSMPRVDPIAFMTECEKLESSRRRPSNNSRMNAVLTSTQDIRRPVDRALPPTLTVYRTSFHGGLKVLPRTPRGSRQTPASNVVVLSLFALPFWLEDLSESQAASFANCLRRQVPTLDDPRGGANPISDSAKDCCRCAFDGANTVGVQLVPDVADPFRA